MAVNSSADERNPSLLDTPIKGLKALRCAAIYGANASGKSNVLNAMRTFSRMVSRSQREWNPTGPIPTWKPFALDEVSSSGDSVFEIDFVIDATVYNYGFKFNSSAILEEWLKDNTGRAKTLFQRETQGPSARVRFPGKNLGATSEDSKHLESIRVQTRANSLFLSSAAQNNHKFLSVIFTWISERFHVISSREESSLHIYTAELCSKPDRKQQIRALLESADAGIADLVIEDEVMPERLQKAVTAMFTAFSEAMPEAAPPSVVKEPFSMSRHNIKMLHRGANGALYPLDFDDESSGTRAYFRMLGPLLDVLRDGSLVLIDELESSLHPLLARELVRMLGDPILNPNGAQLIFATHDTNLLDLDLLRRDQIWLTEKGKDGATVLAALSDYKPRKDQNIALAYLHGRFGAIPVIDEGLVRSALETINPLKAEPFSEESSDQVR